MLLYECIKWEGPEQSLIAVIIPKHRWVNEISRYPWLLECDRRMSVASSGGKVTGVSATMWCHNQGDAKWVRTWWREMVVIPLLCKFIDLLILSWNTRTKSPCLGEADEEMTIRVLKRSDGSITLRGHGSGFKRVCKLWCCSPQEREGDDKPQERKRRNMSWEMQGSLGETLRKEINKGGGASD